MATYYMNEGAFDLPDEGVFLDRTVHVLDDGEVALIVHRAPFPAGTSLRALAAERQAQAAARRPGHAVIEEREAEWAGGPAIEIASRWREEGVTCYERQAHLAVGEQWIYLAINAPLARRAECDGWMEHLRRTLRLREG